MAASYSQSATIGGTKLMHAVSSNSGHVRFCVDLSLGTPSTESNSHIAPSTSKCGGRCERRTAAGSGRSSHTQAPSSATTPQSASGGHACHMPGAHCGRVYRQDRRAHAGSTFVGDPSIVRIPPAGTFVRAARGDCVGRDRGSEHVDSDHLRVVRLAQPELSESATSRL